MTFKPVATSSKAPVSHKAGAGHAWRLNKRSFANQKANKTIQEKPSSTLKDDVVKDAPTSSRIDIGSIPAYPPDQPSKPSFPIQPKMIVGTSNDSFEREADKMAYQVSRASNLRAGVTSRIMAKFNSQSASFSGKQAPAKVVNAIQTKQGKGRSLPDPIRNHMESSFGQDFHSVSVHDDSTAREMNRSLNSRAFTVGSDIYLGRGSVQTKSDEEKSVLSHELTHVVQQRSGIEMGGDGGNGADQVIQRLRIGRIPPEGWASYNGIIDYDKGMYNSCNGYNKFNSSQINSILNTNNESIGDEELDLDELKEGKYTTSDYSKTVLLDRTVASNFSPEVDHIVTRNDYGANDLRNARVLSKAENNALPESERPNKRYTRIAIYEDIEINGTTYSPGDGLTKDNLNDLLEEAGSARLSPSQTPGDINNNQIETLQHYSLPESKSGSDMDL